MNETTASEPIFDIAEFSSIELYSPVVDETVAFFTNLLGMIETHRDGESVYLRGWEDPYRHSLKITARNHAGMGFAGWRAMSPQALDRRVKSLENSGLELGWVDGECGIGPSYAFALPDGSVQHTHWEIDYYQPKPEERTTLNNRIQRRPLCGGAPVRALDHLNLLARNVTDDRKVFSDYLGFKLSEHIVFDDGTEGGAWMRMQTRSHDVALTKDQTGRGGRLHHVAFTYDNTQHLEDACDILTDAGIELEAGPARHAISRAQFVYLFEPGGNRIELVGTPGYTVTDPSWEPVKWSQNELDSAIIWYGAPLPAEFDTYGTPNYGPTKYRTPGRYALAEAATILGR